MKVIYRKIASQYLKTARFELKRSSGWDMDSDSLTKTIEVFKDGEFSGTFEATVKQVSLKEISKYLCAEEMIELISQHQDLVDTTGKVYVAEVINSFLYEKAKGQGIGTKGYLELAKYIYETKTSRKPFLFIPNYCSSHTTSPSAIRVWQSLARKYPSKYEVVVINR